VLVSDSIVDVCTQSLKIILMTTVLTMTTILKKLEVNSAHFVILCLGFKSHALILYNSDFHSLPLRATHSLHMYRSKCYNGNYAI